MSMCDGVTMYAAQHFCAAQGQIGPNGKPYVRFQLPKRWLSQLSARIPSAKSYCESGTRLLHFPSATPSRYELNMSAIAPA
jgi:hypothetical protein